MKYRNLYCDLISRLLDRTMSRRDVANEVGSTIPIDIVYEGNDAALYRNCEWALRHANEQGCYTTEREFEYYLECLMGRSVFSEEERDRRI